MPRSSVMIIDDDDSIGTAVSVRLSAAGYQTTYAQSGRAALELLTGDAALPDAIVLDVRMPDLDGFEVCARLRDHPRTRHIPVIFLTANTASPQRRAAMAALGDAVLSKPYDGRKLLQTLEALAARATPSGK